VKAERKPRWWLRILSAILAIAVLGGAVELVLRAISPGIVADSVREGLGLTPDHPVEVSLSGSSLLNALRGGIGGVTVTVPDAPLLEGVSADGTVRASFVPFDPTRGEIRDGTAELRVDKEQLGSVVSLLTQGVAQTGEVRDGSLVVGRTLELFGQQVPITASLGLRVTEDGEVEVEPRGAAAAGFDLNADQLADVGGGILRPLLETQTVCVRGNLPAGVELTGISLSSTGSAAISADLSPRILSDPAEQQPGSCE